MTQKSNISTTYIGLISASEGYFGGKVTFFGETGPSTSLPLRSGTVSHYGIHKGNYYRAARPLATEYIREATIAQQDLSLR